MLAAVAVAAVVAAVVAALALPVTGGPAALGAPHRASGSALSAEQPRADCDPERPATCTLRQLADQVPLRFGATAEAPQLLEEPYARTLAAEHSSVTPENAMKWYAVQPAPGQWEFAGADAIVAFAEAHDMEVRGHTLVWAQDAFTPDWVEAISDPVELRARVEEQITTVMSRYAGRVHRWDVVNEPLASGGAGLSDSVFWDVLGPDWVADAFRTAHAVDPDAELWLNEYGSDWIPAKHDALVDLARELVEAGVPIDGIGLQTHRLSPDGPDPATFRAQIQDFVDLGLRVAITELDVPIAPTDPTGLVRQAEAYARIVGACLEVPGCDEVTTWGVTDADTWLDTQGILPVPTRPLLFDDQMRPKPAYEAVREVLAAAVRGEEPPPPPPPPVVAPSAPTPPAAPVPSAATFTG